MTEQPKKLFNKNYLLLWQGQSVSRFGSQFYLMAMALWIARETNSATIMGNILMISGLVAVLMGPIGATLADRYSRKKMLIFGDLSRGLIVIGLTLLMIYLPENIEIIVAGIFLVAIYSAVVATFFGPALSASVPDMVPKEALPSANSMGAGSAQLATIIAQASGAVLFPIIGAPILFLFNGVSFLYAAISEIFVKIPQEIPERKTKFADELKSFWQDLVEGFQFVFRRPGLRDTVIISAILAFFTAPAALLLLFFVNDYLDVNPGWYGAILSAYTLGTLIGTVVAGIVKLTPRARGNVILLFIFIQAIGYGLFGLVRNTYLAVSLGFLNGVVTGFILVFFMTIVQIAAPSEKRGRVVGILATINSVFTPIAAGIAGRLVDVVDKNVPIIFIGSGILMTIVVIIVSFNPRFRAFLATDGELPDIEPVQEQVSA